MPNVNGKTIKQIASEIGVSKQAVHQRIKRNSSLQQRLQPFTSTVDGVVYIDVDGEKIIKQLYFGNSRLAVNTIGVNVDSNVDVNVDGDVYSNVDGNVDGVFTALQATCKELTKSLQDQIDSLKEQNRLISEQLNVKDSQLAVKDEQLLAKDKQIEALNVALTTAQQTIADTTAALTAAQALHAGTLQRLTVAAERDEDEAVEAVPEQPTMPDEQAQPKKKGFFARLFGK